MIAKLRSPIILFALIASFGGPLTAASIAEAQLAPKKARSVWNPNPRPASKPCYVCAQPPPPKPAAQRPPNMRPFPMPSASSQMPPKKPLIVVSSTKEWEEFWGVIRTTQAGQTPQRAPRPRPNFLKWRNYTSAYTRESLSKLKKVAMVNVMQPRAQKGKRKRGGNVAKGMCYQAVKETLRDAGLTKEYPWIEKAEDAAPYLRKQTYASGKPMFLDIAPRVSFDANAAPPGSIVVYKGGRYGHIEMKIENQYCSDHCNAVPMDEKLPRKVIAIFLPIAEEN